MRNLKRLSIRFMPNLNLVEHAAFATLENLKTLKLSNNPRLHYINSDGFKDFQDPLILSELDLSHNNIRYLSKDLIPDLQYENTSINLKIKENRLECDCHNQ